RCIRRLVRDVLSTRKKAHERAALLRRVVAHGAAKHRVAGFERVEDRRLRNRRIDGEDDLAVDLGQHPQVLRQDDADHRSVCTSTDRTEGKSRTIGSHEAPPFADAYTWPPVVPK